MKMLNFDELTLEQKIGLTFVVRTSLWEEDKEYIYISITNKKYHQLI